MQAFKSLLIVASLFAAGAALADSSVVNMDTINQTQSGDRNNQTMEFGTVNGGLISGGNARVQATNITQTQGGTGNTQEMTLGKIDKDVGQHFTQVTANRIFQSQTGNNNTQRMKVGVIE